MSTSQKNTNKKRRLLTNRKFNHSLNHHCCNSQEGMCSQCSTLTQVCAEFSMYESFAVWRTAVALKCNIYKDGGLKKL